MASRINRAIELLAQDQAIYYLGAHTGHVEGAVLHPDIDVIGPGAGILAALGAAQHMPGMGAEVIDRLVLCQELDRAVDAACHGGLPSQKQCPIILDRGWVPLSLPLPP